MTSLFELSVACGASCGEVYQQKDKEVKMKKYIFIWSPVWFIAVFMLCTLLSTSTVWADDESRIQRGFELAPVPLNLKGKNRALVGLGSYIVNAQGGCNDCHTHPSYAPGGDPFLGQPEQINAAQYLAGGRVFGPFVSTNLTPDGTGKPAGLTFDEFRDVLRTGHDPDDPPGVLLQVMPWPVYGKMTNRDLRAIYEYLRAIPSRPDNPTPGP